MKIFLIGPPGSGKTTVNLHISQRLNINYIIYRQIVLDFLNEKNKKSEMLKKLWLSFKPFPPLDAFEILKNQLSQKRYKNYALDGFPKSREEASLLVKYYSGKLKVGHQSYTFFLDLERNGILQRLKKRLVCPKCFYIGLNSQNTIIKPTCPYCHSPLIKRKDDEYGKINYRINRYFQEREGIIDEMKKISQVYFIKADNSLAEITNEILEKVLSEKEKNLLWKVEKGARLLLEGLGVDLANPNITKTPTRMAKSLKELTIGLERKSQTEIKELLKTKFPTTYKGMIIMEPIKVSSLCSHHLLPIEYEILFGYIPKNLTIGFSKIIKVIKLIASKPSLQEDFTQEVVDTFKKVLEPEGIMVIVRGKHSCMTIRGEKTASINITSAVRGIFKTSEKTRNEFLSLVRFSNNQKC